MGRVQNRYSIGKRSYDPTANFVSCRPRLRIHTKSSKFFAESRKICQISAGSRARAVAVTSRALAPLAVLIAQPFAVAQSQTPERAPDTMAARVLACASCHGAEGEGTSDVYFPRLAGKPAGYLYNQLVAFGDGRRKYPPMDYLLEFLPDAYLKQVAEHFASLRPPFPAPAIPTVSNEILGRGEQLVKNGDPQLGCGDRGDSTGFDIRLRD